ncbi:hypothetical protein FH972_021333 [Carpinus fangiana]|uniref:Uncharacterized protein n=1 Tax=Carpinus fangiana TaxID=176857 RepID=A0A5N6KPK9_9ROSI|nr:hypothetical protein FH972_021333 [Carpinus fangiana]
MAASQSSWRRPALLVLLVSLFFATASATYGFEQFARRQDLPDINSLTDVIGATTSQASSSRRSSATSAAATTQPSDSSSATQTSAGPTTAAATTATAVSSGSPLPSLYGVGAPELIVPDTSGAPFQQKSDLPEGTVFIIVGAILGFLGMCVLAWRGLVAWALRRSVKRAANTAYAPDTKFGGSAYNDGGYSSLYGASNLSLEHLAAQKTAYGGAGATHTKESSSSRHNKNRRTSRNPSATASTLFFSPTATNGGGASTRSSGFLPAGYYAAGSSNIGGPAANGYGRVDSMESGLDSPGLRPGNAGMGRPGSSGGGLNVTGPRQQGGERRSSRYASNNESNLSVNQQTGTRTPSAYMEDLFSEHGYGPRERF